MDNPVRDKVAVSTQSPSGIDFDKIARVWVRRLYGAQSLEARNLPVLKEVLMHVAAQAREEGMADTRRRTAVEACNRICRGCRESKPMDAKFEHHWKGGAWMECEAKLLRTHFKLADADFAPAEETNGTSQAGKST